MRLRVRAVLVRWAAADEDDGVRFRWPSKRRESEGRRALCLGALVMRGEFERVVQDLDSSAVREAHEDLTRELERWLVGTGLDRAQSGEERRVFAQRLGCWLRQDVVDASWRTEALGVLVWAVGRLPSLPAWDTQFDQQAVIVPLGLLGNSPLLTESPLRPQEEIEAARDVAELWHWRARTTQLQQRPGVELPAGQTFEEIISMSARGALEAGDIAGVIDDDFPAFGKAYHALDRDEYAIATSIAQERHFALNWLCGYSRDWDETPTDT